MQKETLEITETQKWIEERLASIFGADGRGGSGIFVYLEDGRLAVLTARHVVVSCVLTGALTIPISEPPCYSVEPTAIRIDGLNDVALLLIDSGIFSGEALSFKEWTCPGTKVYKGMSVITSGDVGEWKQLDPETRTISLIKVLHLCANVTNSSGMITCDVDTSIVDLPTSFRGMSGGPLFSINRHFLGVNAEELSCSQGRAILVTPVEKLTNLYTPFRPTENALLDYMRQPAKYEFWAVEKNGQRRIRMSVCAEYWWSKSSPDVPDGCIGRIISVQFGTNTPAMDIELVFRWYDSNTDEERRKALEEELVFFLENTGFEFEE